MFFRTERVNNALTVSGMAIGDAVGAVAVVLPMSGMIAGDSHPQQSSAAPPSGVAKFRLDLASITLPGMKAFRETLMMRIKPGIEVVTLDSSFNDSFYAETVLQLFDAMMQQ